ncbi:hypothetical protein SSCG_01879 [Streptomyces clavuligerus]|nr:hypothetical protein SSCG_01879 [Streptomyces clavuligerus]
MPPVPRVRSGPLPGAVARPAGPAAEAVPFRVPWPRGAAPARPLRVPFLGHGGASPPVLQGRYLPSR